ncbi:MAG: PIG-L family deacetylase, partial [Betaproteobacteria bacterium]|nr:PIG-L family deacetylase [Betaproteobacteria bacterium]
MMRYVRRTVAALLVLVGVTGVAQGQERGAAAVDQLVRSLAVTGRVLMIAAHPDDEDTRVIAWLTRGRGVETAYLSLTRGDGGQNLIGNELGEALGAIRTEELLAARRVDGGHQFFTRAFDFGFSKNSTETFKHWPHDSLLGDVVTVIRAFRPQVVISVWSGTAADGHGHHTVAGILAKEGFDAAGDTIRFPAAKFGQPWEPAKFYRTTGFNRVSPTMQINVGEFDPVLGRSYAEIAAESRAQHRSQGFGGVQQPKGMVMAGLRREASRVNAATPAEQERSIFDGVDTTFARFTARSEGDPTAAARGVMRAVQPALDSARRA